MEHFVGQKRQLSPSDDAERKFKVRILNSFRKCRSLEISDLSQLRKKPKHLTRRFLDPFQPNRAEEWIFDVRRTLNANFKTLKEEMDALEVVRILKENSIIGEEFYKKYKVKKTRREKVEILLIEIDRLMTEGDDPRKLQILPAFIKALKESDQDDLVTVLQAPPHIQELKCSGNDTNDMYRFLHNAKDTIIETIEPRRFIDDVVTIQGINLQEYGDIINKCEREDRAGELLLKIKESQYPLRIIKPMCDSYCDLYSKFKSSEKAETANTNEKGTAVAVRYRFKETVVREDTNEHSHPITEIRKLQQRLVDTTNDNPEQFERLREEISNDTRLQLSRLSLSSVKLHLRTTSATSLEDLKKCCRNGKAIEWLMTVLKPDDIRKLMELDATDVKLECYIDDEDSKKQLFDESFQECLCVLNRDSLKNNLISFQDDLDGFELTVTDILLESKTLDVMLAKSLSNARAKAAEFGTKNVLTNFLIQEEEEVPETCFCIIEKELVKNLNSSTIQQLQEKILGCPDSYAENVETTIRNNLKENTDLLEDELDGRWFLPSLKCRTEEKYLKIVEEIERSRSRKSRTKPFVRFLCEEEDVEWFVKELKEYHPHVLAILSHQKNLTELSVFRNAMLSVYDFIIKEVEPFELKSHLRTSCMTQLQFDDIEKIHDRRERAFFFMKQLFRQENLDRVQDVMDAFASKYTNIEKAVKDVSRKGSTSQLYRCPRIERHQMKMAKIIFTTDFTLPGLEKTDDEVIGKDLLLKENISLDEQAVNAHDISRCEVQITEKKADEIPDEWSSELPLSSSSLHSSETKCMLKEDIYASKTVNDIDNEQKQREVIIETGSNMVEYDNKVSATRKEVSLYKSDDHIKIEENMKISICEEKELEMNKDELTIRESFSALAGNHSYKKQLHIEDRLVAIFEGSNCNVSTEQTFQNQLTDKVSTNTPTQIKKKSLTLKMSKLQNDPIKEDYSPDCQDIKLEEQPLKHMKNTAADFKDIHTTGINCKQVQQVKTQEQHTDTSTSAETTPAVKNKTSDQTLNKSPRCPNSNSRRSADFCQKSGTGSQSDIDIASFNHTVTMKSNAGASDCVVGSKAESISVNPKPSTVARNFRIKLSPKPTANRKSHEFYSFEHTTPGLPVGYAMDHQRHFGPQNNYSEYWQDFERERRQNEEYWHNEWFHRKRMRQTMWQPQHMWRERNTHNRGYSYPPMWSPPYSYNYFNYTNYGNVCRETVRY